MGRALYPQDLRSTSVDSDQAQGAPSPTDAPNNPFAGLDGPQVRPFWSGANSSVLETLEPRAAQRPPAPHPTLLNLLCFVHRTSPCRVNIPDLFAHLVSNYNGTVGSIGLGSWAGERKRPEYFFSSLFALSDFSDRDRISP